MEKKDKNKKTVKLLEVPIVPPIDTPSDSPSSFAKQYDEFIPVIESFNINLSDPKCNQEGLKLNLGCGNAPMKGFINIDKFNTGYTDVIADMRTLPFTDGKVAMIVCYESLEHLPINDILPTLKEFYRVLKRDGQVVITVPDIVSYCQRVVDNPDDDYTLVRLFGSQETEGQFHRSGFTAKKLFHLFGMAGFRLVKVANFTTNKVTNLYCEAVK